MRLRQGTLLNILLLWILGYWGKSLFVDSYSIMKKLEKNQKREPEALGVGTELVDSEKGLLSKIDKPKVTTPKVTESDTAAKSPTEQTEVESSGQKDGSSQESNSSKDTDSKDGEANSAAKENTPATSSKKGFFGKAMGLFDIVMIVPMAEQVVEMLSSDKKTTIQRTRMVQTTITDACQVGGMVSGANTAVIASASSACVAGGGTIIHQPVVYVTETPSVKAYAVVTRTIVPQAVTTTASVAMYQTLQPVVMRTA
ncbi:hypothetical protein DASC09_048220 [Saccharomycopsis crataegensis]|uniref:Uncharacterized protein n=1 Tax=Saccharomycopsis crataegensis TaxID=43959 RepID=A0AAV5QRH8_9ASCO|nr:hypothetical protein DASC09_048220 [Saccharomycopsis crataegensis]